MFVCRRATCRHVHGFANGSPLRHKLGQTKVEDLGLPAPRDENVRRLDVPVHDSARVRHIEPIGDLNAELQDLFDVERLAADQMLQRLPLKQLHGDKRASFMFVNVVDGADVGMV